MKDKIEKVLNSSSRVRLILMPCKHKAIQTLKLTLKYTWHFFSSCIQARLLEYTVPIEITI